MTPNEGRNGSEDIESGSESQSTGFTGVIPKVPVTVIAVVVVEFGSQRDERPWYVLHVVNLRRLGDCFETLTAAI